MESQYAHRTDEARDEVEKLNQMVEAEDKFASEEGQLSICGTCLPTWLRMRCLQHCRTFSYTLCTPLGNPPVLEPTRCLPLPLPNGKFVYLAYTKDHVFQYQTGLAIGDLSVTNLVGDVKANPLGALPIIEYPNNRWRIGDWGDGQDIARSITEEIVDLEGFELCLWVSLIGHRKT